MSLQVTAGHSTSTGTVVLTPTGVSPTTGNIEGYISNSEAVGKRAYIDGHASSALITSNGYFIVEGLSPGYYSILQVEGFQSYSL